MSNFYINEIQRIALVDHKCSYCGERVSKGDTYTLQKGHWDGRWFESKMHPECFDDLCQNGDGEYTLYSNDRPKIGGAS